MDHQLKVIHSLDIYILTSTLHESYLFRIDGRDSITRMDASSTGLLTTQRTLALANIPRRVVQQGGSSYVDSSYVVQITPHGLHLTEYDSTLDTFTASGCGWYLQQQQTSGWDKQEIVAGAINPSQFAAALSGGTVLLFNLSTEGEINLTS